MAAAAGAADAAGAVRVLAVGCGHDGRLGVSRRTEQNHSTPVQLAFFDDKVVRGVYAGGAHSMVLCSDGLYAFGCGENGQLGLGTKDYQRLPQAVESVRDADRVKVVSLGNSHTLVLEDGGRLLVCGGNSCGQLGDGEEADRQHLHELDAAAGARLVSAGSKHSLCVVGDDVLSWGLGDQGQLGYAGDAFDAAAAKAERVRAQALREAQQRAREGPAHHSASPIEQSEVGQYNPRLHPKFQRQGGAEFFEPFCQRRPQRVAFTFSGVQAVAAGWNHSCVLDADGVYAFGGRCGSQRETVDDLVPRLIAPPHPELTVAQFFALESMRAMLCRAPGGTLSVWVQGEGLHDGELGLGADSSGDPIEDAPEWRQALDGLPGGSVAHAGGATVAVSRPDGTVITFGSNFYGQLAHGHDRPSPCPAAAQLSSDGGRRCVMVAVGRHHCLFGVGAGGSQPPPADARGPQQP
eukprot:TRINITY_DN51707_c0_g1_i1.p1 TRINITY_DN51707_c0_g1~~TRINITY_DN51707_c0_g1_i1.p1  ORF type:complete len:464 (+),score=113.72 TRINITY_DN51707_c0_g1_i1:75-1466(+)